MDIHTLQTTVRDFAAVRGWPRWHTPKNLAMALIVEAAELLEIFQWMTPDESAAAASDPAEKQRIGEEIADVQIYLLQMAQQTRIDVAAAVLDKLQRNARRYPAPSGEADVALPALSAADQPVTHVLVDYENVQPTDAQVRALVPQATRLWVFHGPHQKDMATRFASFGSGLSIIPISQTGKNALDFHLSFYMGYIAARHPSGHFVVLANDKGYEPMLEHARQLHFDVQAIGLPRRRKATGVAKPVAKSGDKPATKPAAPRKAAARPAVKKVADAKPAATPKGTKPANDIKAVKGSATATKTAPVKTGAKAPPAAKMRPRKTAAPAPVPATALPPVPAPAVAAPPAAKPVARKTTPRARTAAAPPPPPAARRKAASVAAAAPAVPAEASVSAAAMNKVEQGLRKLDNQRRPVRLARLRGVLKSLLGTEASTGTIDAALARLQAQGLVRVDAGGAVTYPPM